MANVHPYTHATDLNLYQHLFIYNIVSLTDTRPKLIVNKLGHILTLSSLSDGLSREGNAFYLAANYTFIIFQLNKTHF